MKKFYQTMKVITHGDSVLVAQGVGHNRDEWIYNPNVGILRLGFVQGRLRLESWGRQRGYVINDYNKIFIE